MADIIASVGGAPHLRRAMYRDNSDGSHSETRAAEMWLWDTDNSVWTKLTLAEFKGTSLDTSTIYAGTTALTPSFAFANVAAGQTDSALVAAVSSKKIRVLALAMVTAATATNVTFNTKPGGAGSAISPLFANGANGGAVLPFNPVGWFQTSSGEGLSVTTSAGSTTGIQVVYVEVP